MLSIEECRQHLKGLELSDEQIEQLRDVLYSIIEQVLDKELRH